MDAIRRQQEYRKILREKVNLRYKRDRSDFEFCVHNNEVIKNDYALAIKLWDEKITQDGNFLVEFEGKFNNIILKHQRSESLERENTIARPNKRLQRQIAFDTSHMEQEIVTENLQKISREGREQWMNKLDVMIRELIRASYSVEMERRLLDRTEPSNDPEEMKLRQDEETLNIRILLKIAKLIRKLTSSKEHEIVGATSQIYDLTAELIEFETIKKLCDYRGIITRVEPHNFQSTHTISDTAKFWANKIASAYEEKFGNSTFTQPENATRSFLTNLTIEHGLDSIFIPPNIRLMDANQIYNNKDLERAIVLSATMYTLVESAEHKKPPNSRKFATQLIKKVKHFLGLPNACSDTKEGRRSIHEDCKQISRIHSIVDNLANILNASRQTAKPSASATRRVFISNTWRAESCRSIISNRINKDCWICSHHEGCWSCTHRLNHRLCLSCSKKIRTTSTKNG